MEELKNLIKEKTGITDAQAGQAVEIMATYVKERVPGLIHGQLDKIFAGKHLEDSFRDQVNELGNEVKERTEGLAKDLKEAFDGAFKTKKTD
jgi:hypothetical protein